MFPDESTVTTTSTPDQIDLRTDVSAPFLVFFPLTQFQEILGIMAQL